MGEECRLVSSCLPSCYNCDLASGHSVIHSYRCYPELHTRSCELDPAWAGLPKHAKLHLPFQASSQPALTISLTCGPGFRGGVACLHVFVV